MTADLALLALLWALWCCGHSLLITPRADAFFRRHLGPCHRWFRLGYNLFALASLAIILAWSLGLPYPKIVVWQWPYTLLQYGLWAAAGWLFYGGARGYPLKVFLGLDAFGGRRGEERGKVALVRDGVHRLVRHPWYLGALIVLWSRDLGPQGLTTSAVLSIYLVAGARLEERKLIAEYGDEYLRYRREVPMILPWKVPAKE